MDEIMKLVANKLQDKDERIRLARKLLEDEGSLAYKTAFLHKESGNMITLGEMIEKEGYDKTLEMVVQILESLAEKGGESYVRQFNADDVNAAIVRVKNGEGSEDDEALAKMFGSGEYADTLKEKNSENMMHMILQNWFDMVHFAMEDKGYVPQLSDLTTMVEMIIVETLVLTPSSALYKFKDARSSTPIINIGKQVAEDMEKACRSTIWKDKTIAPEYILMGLISWMNQIIITNEYDCVSAQEMIDHMDIGSEVEVGNPDGNEQQEQEQAENIPGVAQPICHGSNNGKVIPFENNAMKNLLKDD